MRSDRTIIVDRSVEPHQLRFELCQRKQGYNRCQHHAQSMGSAYYQPSGRSQILAASGLSGDALLGSEIGIR